MAKEVERPEIHSVKSSLANWCPSSAITKSDVLWLLGEVNVWAINQFQQEPDKQWAPSESTWISLCMTCPQRQQKQRPKISPWGQESGMTVRALNSLAFFDVWRFWFFPPTHWLQNSELTWLTPFHKNNSLHQNLFRKAIKPMPIYTYYRTSATLSCHRSRLATAASERLILKAASKV
jgi:hypothetical protein